jgi:phage gpG-like protein
MAKVAETFGAAIAELRSLEGFGMPGRGKKAAAGTAIRFGRFAQSREEHLGGSVLITIDPSDIADAMGRINAYKSIPSVISQEVFANVANYFLKDIIVTNFETESGPLGMWPELSFTQVRRRGGESHPILIHTGSLFSRVTSSNWMEEASVGGQYARLVLGPKAHWDDLTILKYYVHNLGSSNGFGKGIAIPARPFIPVEPGDLTTEQRQDINKIVINGIKQGLEERQARRELRRNPRPRPMRRPNIPYSQTE